MTEYVCLENTGLAGHPELQPDDICTTYIAERLPKVTFILHEKNTTITRNPAFLRPD
ncbi:MAG: hypothetical protein ACL93V_04370 [Candidatus Electrothrix sp. YB6]